MNQESNEKVANFVEQIVRDDLASGKNGKQLVTRFPPEPNGYLHIGHAKSICLNFGLPKKFAEEAQPARCHLRFDDTNPTKEEQVYIDAIKQDIRWLGFDWGEHEHYASDYFDQLYAWAVALIQAGKAYVDDQSAEEVRASRGTLTQPGVASPYRDRSPKENLELLEQMKAGKFKEGEKVLRAKIDMASPNLTMRDPVMYRIMHVSHPRTSDTWCIYPTYDFTHGQSDWIEGVTHSICTLEFEEHRPLYDWFVEQLQAIGEQPTGANHRPRQYEFARLNLTYMLMSKRKLLTLVQEKAVDGWDDPRMPTLSGMRRRGYSPQAIRQFCETIGVTRFKSKTEFQLLEHCLRDDLNRRAQRRMAVLHPLKVVITNWPEGKVDELEAGNNPEDESAGLRLIPFSGTLYIERDDFMTDPPKKFFRLGPGREVRLRYGYFVTCEDYVTDDQGNVVEVRCTYDPETRGGNAPDGRKVKGTIHWVSADHAVDAQVNQYDHLFTDPNPDKVSEGSDWRKGLNPDSLSVVTDAKLEPALKNAKPGEYYQFERVGYFMRDSHEHGDAIVFNRTVTLKDSWARVADKK